MGKNVQISAELFDALCSYFLDDQIDDRGKGMLHREISDELCSKIEKMVTRQMFTDYKTAAPGSDEREQARLKYLQRVGMNKHFTTDTETPGL